VALALVAGITGIISQAATAAGLPHYYVNNATGNDLPGNNCATLGNPCATITYALTKATSGGTIKIAAGNGPYITPLSIGTSSDNVELLGKAGTILQPTSYVAGADPLSPSTPQDALVYVAPSVTGFSIKKMTIDGTNAFGAATQCSDDFLGVEYNGSTGSLNHVTVQHVQQTGGFGCQPGANGDVLVDSGGATTADVTMTKVTASTYDKDGITCQGSGTTCSITKSNVTGSGIISTNAQNGIGIYSGATGTVTKSRVSGNSYNAQGAPVQTGSGPGCQLTSFGCYSATGILGYGATSFTVNDNTSLTANDDNVVDAASSNVAITNNSVVTAATDAIDGAAQGIVAEDEPGGSSVTVSGNTVTGDVGGGIQDIVNTGAVVSNNVTSNDSSCILIEEAEATTVSGNTANHCTSGGITAAVSGRLGTSGSGPDVTSNTAEHDGTGGIIFDGTSEGEIENNVHIADNSGSDVPGLVIDGSSDNTISGNTLSSNFLGAVLTGAAAPNEVCGTLTFTDGVTTAASADLSSATAGFQTSSNEDYNGWTVLDDSDPGNIPVGTTISATNSPTDVTMSANATTGGTDYITLIGNSACGSADAMGPASEGGTRTVSDASTNGTYTLNSATAQFRVADVGAVVSGGSLASGTFITHIVSKTEADISTSGGTETGGSLSIDLSNDPAVAGECTAASIPVGPYCDGFIGSYYASNGNTFTTNTVTSVSGDEGGVAALGPNAPAGGWTLQPAPPGVNNQWFGVDTGNQFTTNVWTGPGALGNAGDFTGPPGTATASLENTWSGNTCNPTTANPTCTP
jgi:parallel beta-helix repeat protein